MNQYTQGCVNSQVRRAQRHRQQLVTDHDLCLTKLLPKAQIASVLDQHKVRFRQCVYTPVVTLWTFLYQVLAADQSCRAAVARLLSRLCLTNAGLISAKTGPYCKARQRLPEACVADLARRSGHDLQGQTPVTGLLGSRPIKIVDGTTVSMPDTPANQKAYPQQPGQKPGIGFPIIRLVGLIGLSCGAVLDIAMAPYSGKKTGETSLLRQLLGHLKAGDVLLADAMFSNYWTIAQLHRQGVDLIGHHDGKRRVDYRKGQRLGRYDHVVRWHKPKRRWWMSQRFYHRLPEALSIRELKISIAQKGFRRRQLHLVTTLLDAERYRAQTLATAFRARWHAELDFRSIKQVMQMDVLRCKSPDMVCKEIWMHLLAYNLIRTLMVQAAQKAGCCPRDISFTGALQTLAAFAATGYFHDPRGNRIASMYTVILMAIAAHRVNDRPDRVEPRAVKRRPKKLVYLNESRHIARKRLLNET